jgi:UDP-3-O-[3-hydroxymyristoyl] glucosamine N-acyltransferase
MTGMKLGELAKRLGADLVAGEGSGVDAETEVTGVAGIEDAGPRPGDVLWRIRKYAGMAKTTKAAALIVEPEFGADAGGRRCG